MVIYILYTIHNTQYTIHNTQYTIHNTLYTIHYTPYTIHNTQYTNQQQVSERVPLVEQFWQQHCDVDRTGRVLGHAHGGAALVLCVCVWMCVCVCVGGVDGVGCSVKRVWYGGWACRVQSAECRVQSAECRVQSAECRVCITQCSELSKPQRCLSAKCSSHFTQYALRNSPLSWG
jgi:hypothetical protein